ncbi:MAG: hypothetical protein CME59_02600 [Halioglobus sp.]|nr:hypothetical protein [Halioglobus sp.]
MDGAAQDGSGQRRDEMDAARESVSAALDKLVEARDHFRQAVEAAGLDIADEAEARVDAGRRQLGELDDRLQRAVQDQPLRSLGFAALAGFVLARLVSR